MDFKEKIRHTGHINPLKFCSIESSGDDVPPDTKLNDVMHLAELCIDLLHQNEEHHAEVGGRLIWSTQVSTPKKSQTQERRNAKLLIKYKGNEIQPHYFNIALSFSNLNA